MISVVICTHNRADILKMALKTLCQQKLPLDQYEILVVDNASTDHTREIVEEFSRELVRIRYIVEPQVGISLARNRGLKEAVGDYIGYCDDDCKLPSDWLTKAQTIISQHTPDIFGGPYLPFYISDKPQWFKDAYGSSRYAFEVKEPILFDAERPASRYISSGNMFLRRDLLEFGFKFNAELGPVGAKGGYAEDTAFVYHVQREKADAKIYYDPDLFVYHLVRPNKLNLGWRFRSQYEWGRDMGRMYYTNAGKATNLLRFTGGRILQILQIVFGLLFDLVYAPLLRNREQYPYVKNYFYEQSAKRFGLLGNWVAQIKYRRSNS